MLQLLLLLVCICTTLSREHDSFVGIHNYAQGVKAALNGVDVAFDGLQRAQSALADALAGTNGHSRCLFTNAHPQLGNLSAILKMMSETFNNINKVQETFQESLKLEVGNILQELMDLDNEEGKLVCLLYTCII